MLYLAWTAVEYATYVEETKNCTDCKCTPLNQQKRNARTWIFDGRLFILLRKPKDPQPLQLLGHIVFPMSLGPWLLQLLGHLAYPKATTTTASTNLGHVVFRSYNIIISLAKHFSVLDSIGKVPSGILGGNNLWVGSWTTCRKIHVIKNSQG